MAAVLWSEGISTIDTFVISHADTDHFNAVPDLLERFRVKEMVVSAAFLRSESAAVADLLLRIRRAAIPLRIVAAGDSFAIDQLCRVRVLHPHASTTSRPSRGTRRRAGRRPRRRQRDEHRLGGRGVGPQAARDG